MKAKSIKGNSPSEIKNALEESMTGDFNPTLALVFISIKQDRNEVCDILNNKGIDYLGATSSGEFIDGFQSEGEIALMLLEMKKEDFCILFEAIGDRSLEDTATQLAQSAMLKFDNPGIILCSTSLTEDGRFLDGEILINSMAKVVGPQVSMFGGMAGDDITFTGTYVFTNERSTDYGMAALVLNQDKISMKGVAISGWKPMGVSRTVTKSKGNLMYTIDDSPALEMYVRFLGKDITSAEDQIEFYNSIGVHYPFQIERPGREPKICNPIGYDTEEKALVCETEVPQGSKIRFSTPPDFDIVETIMEKAKDLKEGSGAEADALLIFSCAGRLNALGPLASEENEGLSEVWNAPMAGFYTYGEFGKSLSGVHEFHSTTCSWVVLNEK